MEAWDHQPYEYGATRCAPTPAVLKNIQKQVRASRALSPADVRLAEAMGLVSADVQRPLGFNDGVFYPPGQAPGLALARKAPPSRQLAQAPAQKKLHAMGLLVDFSDNPGTRPAADFQKLLFDAADPNSMTSSYSRLSNSRLQVTGEVVGYVRAPQKYSYYTAGKSGTGNNYPQNTPGLLVHALTEYCKNDNLTRFDVDGDGYVDGIFLIHAGGGAEAEPDPAKRPNMIWSHKWVLPTPFVHQGVSVYAYSTEPEDGRVGVFAHEFGHVLGLPDLYDTSYRTNGLGDWCLMAGGSWGGNGNRPCRMSAWCLSKLGWVKPAVVKKSRSLSLKPLEQNRRACYRLWSKGKPGPEYFLIENRQATGMDSSLPGSGLAVWHVDETQSGNTNPLSPLVGLLQADGRRDLEMSANEGDAGDLLPGTKRVTKLSDGTNPSTRAHDHSPTGVAISKVKEQAGLVTLRVKV